MLLPQEANAIEHLARPGTSGFKPFFQLGVLHLEPLHPLGMHARATRSGLERFYSCFGVKSTPAESCKLVAEVSHELLQIFKSFELRTFAV